MLPCHQPQQPSCVLITVPRYSNLHTAHVYFVPHSGHHCPSWYVFLYCSYSSVNSNKSDFQTAHRTQEDAKCKSYVTGFESSSPSETSPSCTHLLRTRAILHKISTSLRNALISLREFHNLPHVFVC